MIRRVLPSKNSKECVAVGNYNTDMLLVAKDPSGEPFLFTHDVAYSTWVSHSLRRGEEYSRLCYIKTSIVDIVSQLTAYGWEFFELGGDRELSDWLRERRL